MVGDVVGREQVAEERWNRLRGLYQVDIFILQKQPWEVQTRQQTRLVDASGGHEVEGSIR